MESSALIPSQSGPVFSQQGTVDWTQLAKSSVTLSLEILSRLSQSGVEPLTLAVGQTIFSGFLLPPSTQHKIHTALERLKPLSSYSNALWFGFGIKHVVRSLVESEQGIACVVICAGLSVSYDRFYCAQVLRSMAQIQSAPGHLSPSIPQWSSLIDTCSGTLLSTDFPNLVEGFSRLWYNNENQTMWKRWAATSPYALAEAMATLRAISKGNLENATFVGGADCAWIAAIADGMVDRVFAGGRSTWDSLLADTFPAESLYLLFSTKATSAFTYVLHEASSRINSVLGVARRTLDILPELEPISSNAWTDCKSYERARTLLVSLCACSLCEMGLPHTKYKRFHHSRSEELCLTGIVNAILQYIWILAHVDLHGDIQPSSRGLRYLYTITADGLLTVDQIGTRLISFYQKNNVLLTILQTITGIPVQEELGLGASAVSESGVSICCASLLDPTLAPTARAPFYLLPGHIQKDCSLFREVYDLDPHVPWRVDETIVLSCNFDQKLGLMTNIRQSKSLPTLLVKETLQARRLQANYSWQYQLLHQDPTTQPYQSSLSSTPSTKMIIPAFGNSELQRRLYDGVCFPHCLKKKIGISVPGNIESSRTCCKVSDDIYMLSGNSAASLPRPGEWVLLDVGRQGQTGEPEREDLPTKIYLGSIVELYSLLCVGDSKRRLKLVRTVNCIFCTCLWKSRNIVIVYGQGSPTQTVFADGITVLEPEDERRPHSNDEGDYEATNTAVAPAASLPPAPQQVKSNKRKNTTIRRSNRKRKTTSI
ncbi:hypothetical protein BJX64DRAFT_289823 [Aspergillus heterothallicus]